LSALDDITPFTRHILPRLDVISLLKDLRDNAQEHKENEKDQKEATEAK